MELAQIIANFARFDIEKMICEDPSEFWETFLTRANLLELFQVKRVIATRCENCFAITGINHNTCMLDIILPNLEKSAMLKNIIWDAFTGQCITPNEAEPCGKCALKSKSWAKFAAREHVFLLNCPAVSVIRFDIVAVGSNHKTRGESTRSTHFTAMLMDSEKAYEYDNLAEKRFLKNKKINQEQFKETIYMAFYVRKDCFIDCLTAHDNERVSWSLSYEKLHHISNVFIKGDNDNNLSILTSNILSGSSLITDEEISAFICSQLNVVDDAYSTSSFIFGNVKDGFKTQEYSEFISNVDVLKNRVILFPYKAAKDEWSLILIRLNESG